MAAFLLRRILGVLLVLVFTAGLSFLLVKAAPGGPFDAERQLDPAARAALESRYGLDRPVAEQFLRYLGNLVRLDFGYSTHYPDRLVEDIIAENLPWSVALGALALATALLLAVPTALAASLRPGRCFDRLALAAALFGTAMPGIVLAPLLILLAAFGLGVLPAGLFAGPRSLILPVLTLALPFAARLFLIIRDESLTLTRRPFIDAARARGLGPRRIALVHLLRNILPQLTAFLAPGAAALLTGSIVVETIFVLPGIGRYFVQAAVNRDVTLVTAVVLVYTTLLVLLNLSADIVHGLADPRLRRAGGTR
jgi:oligopeptide transport system permease protein